jgi:phosphoenolpyruvate carboxykinase (ATP)
VLTPRATWKSGTDYDAQARKLAAMFVDNFKTFEAEATPEVRAAGPHV